MMTNLEHYTENAISFIENSGEYKDFFNQPLLKELAEETGISLSDMWEIAQYTVCTYKPWVKTELELSDHCVILSKEEFAKERKELAEKILNDLNKQFSADYIKSLLNLCTRSIITAQDALFKWFRVKIDEVLKEYGRHRN